MCKIYTRFQTETAQKRYPLGGGGGAHTCYLAYMREYLPGLHSTRHNTNLPSNLKNVALAYKPSVEKKIESRTFQKMILYRLYRSLDRDWRSDAPSSPGVPPRWIHRCIIKKVTYRREKRLAWKLNWSIT